LENENAPKNDCNAESNSFRLDKKPGVRERIEYLVGQAQERLIEKRMALEEQLWGVMEADLGNYFETHEAAKVGKGGELETDGAGKMLTVRKQRPKLLSDLPSEFRKLIEDVMVDKNGNVIPRLYSKAQANRGLRELLRLGQLEDRPQNDVSRLSDAELIQQLSDQAKELGIEINLNYSFAQPAANPTLESDVEGPDEEPPQGSSGSSTPAIEGP
jgi:hypothetical protein